MERFNYILILLICLYVFYKYLVVEEIKMFLQYREAAIAGLTTQFFWGIMLVFIYIAFYSNGGNESINLEQMSNSCD